MKAIMEKKAVNKTVICLMVENQPNVLARIFQSGWPQKL